MGSIVSTISAAYRALRCNFNVRDAPGDGDSVPHDSSFVFDEVPGAVH